MSGLRPLQSTLLHGPPPFGGEGKSSMRSGPNIKQILCLCCNSIVSSGLHLYGPQIYSLHSAQKCFKLLLRLPMLNSVYWNYVKLTDFRKLCKWILLSCLLVVTNIESLLVGWESSVEESITKIIIYSESNIDITSTIAHMETTPNSIIVYFKIITKNVGKGNFGVY
jgi:hypothetical protein